METQSRVEPSRPASSCEGNSFVEFGKFFKDFKGNAKMDRALWKRIRASLVKLPAKESAKRLDIIRRALERNPEGVFMSLEQLFNHSIPELDTTFGTGLEEITQPFNRKDVLDEDDSPTVQLSTEVAQAQREALRFQEEDTQIGPRSRVPQARVITQKISRPERPSFSKSSASFVKESISHAAKTEVPSGLRRVKDEDPHNTQSRELFTRKELEAYLDLEKAAKNLREKGS